MKLNTEVVAVTDLQSTNAATGKITRTGNVIYLKWREGQNTEEPVRAITVALTPAEATEYAIKLLEVAGARVERMPAGDSVERVPAGNAVTRNLHDGD